MATADNAYSNVPVVPPTGRQRLGRLLDRMARRNDSGSPDVILAGDFRVDLVSRSVLLRGRPLPLDSAEFDALVYLASHRKRVVTAHTMLATKPQESGMRRTRLLPTLLSLRKKLEEAVPGSHYLETEAWVLYDFHPAI